MADQPITQLPVATALTGSEVTAVVQNGITKQALVSLIANAVSPGKLIIGVSFVGSNLVFQYSDGTTASVGPIPGYIAATVNSNGDLILTSSTGGTTNAGHVVGATGATGPAGPTGPQGPQGNPGTPGANGTAATISVGVTNTGAPGSYAVVSNSGTSQNAIFNFTIPSGITGATGPAGTAATIAAGTAVGLSYGSTPTVTNTGNASAAVFNFGIPAGAPGAGFTFVGTWNAATNTPPISSGVGAQGAYYQVSTAGTTTVDGVSLWSVGDLIIYNGSAWIKILGATANEKFNNITLTSLTGYAYANGSGTLSASTTIPTTVLSGTITNAQLANSSLTIGTTNIALGATSLTLAGLTSVTVTQDPTTDFELTTKQYVDNKVSTGITYHDPVQVATTQSLAAQTGGTVTYNAPGPQGVGATITLSVALTTLDGYSLSNTNRILVKDEVSQAYNGIYTWATGGTVLTRATDANTYGPNVGQLSQNDYFFVQNGTVNKGSSWVVSTIGTINFTTTPITFGQFSTSQVYSAGTGLTLTGTTFSLTTPVATLNGGTGLSSFTSGGAVYATSTSVLTTGTLPVSAGGTGVTTSTGSGSVVLSTSPSLVTPILGTPQSGNFSTGTFTWPTFNQNTTGTAANVTGVVAIANGGTGQTSASSAFNALSPITSVGDLIIGNGTNTATRLAIGSTGYLLTSNGTTASWQAAPSGMVYPAAGIPNSTGSAWGTSYSTTGSGTIVALATSPSFTTPILGTPQSGNFSTGTFTWPTFNQNTTGSAGSVANALTIGTGLSGTSYNGSAAVTINLANTTVTAGSYTNANITVDAQGRITLASNGSAGGVTSFSAGTTGFTPSSATTGAITLAGTLATTNGGTGLTSFTSGGAVYATSTSALTTGTLPIASGGTGQTTASAAFNALSPITTAGDLILGNGTNSATRLAIGTNGYILTSNGTTASWAAAPATGLTVTSTTSNTNYNIGFQSASSGTTTVDYINTSFTANPSTGAMTAPNVVASNGMLVHSTTVATSYSIPVGSNALAAGPMTVASGAAVTIPSGSRWLVL